MGDLIPFRRRPKAKRWTKPEDYGARDFGKVLPTGQWQGKPRAKPRGPIGRFVAGLVPWLVVLAASALWWVFDNPGAELPAALSTTPVTVSGTFTRCGPGRGTLCVIDGDSFHIGARKIRIAGIDAPETHPPRCAREGELGEAATARLQALLSAGPFAMSARIDQPTDKYGRELASLTRRQPDGTTQSLAEAMIASGAARRYDGGARLTWC